MASSAWLWPLSLLRLGAAAWYLSIRVAPAARRLLPPSHPTSGCQLLQRGIRQPPFPPTLLEQHHYLSPSLSSRHYGNHLSLRYLPIRCLSFSARRYTYSPP
ncbi:hypothetical protein BKA56DRAFT_612203 [Ilyonectria sp. MPI-CAGE-AT-0026]|nr:hypothetical protein BKA56DRAFT_612203 [Ilyonectria sp. MPI-CAGE-AT-0026]